MGISLDIINRLGLAKKSVLFLDKNFGLDFAIVMLILILTTITIKFMNLLPERPKDQQLFTNVISC